MRIVIDSDDEFCVCHRHHHSHSHRHRHRHRHQNRFKQRRGGNLISFGCGLATLFMDSTSFHSYSYSICYFNRRTKVIAGKSANSDYIGPLMDHMDHAKFHNYGERKKALDDESNDNDERTEKEDLRKV